MGATDDRSSRPLVLHVGSEELVIRRRHEVLSIVNDILVAVWFVIGSVSPPGARRRRPATSDVSPTR